MNAADMFFYTNENDRAHEFSAAYLLKTSKVLFAGTGIHARAFAGLLLLHSCILGFVWEANWDPGDYSGIWRPIKHERRSKSTPEYFWGPFFG